MKIGRKHGPLKAKGSGTRKINPKGWPIRQNYKFTGKERDSESGLDYFGARHFTSQFGRFMSPDPSGLFYADPTNPQSLNLYSYVRNNPLSFTDPTGEQCVWDDGSYDSADDPNTGGRGQCTQAGGTYFNPTYFNAPNGDWSNQGNSGLANAASLSQRADSGSCPSGTICSNAYGNGDNPWFTPSPAFNGLNLTPPTDQQKLMAVKVAGMQASHDLGCVAKAEAGMIPFAGYLTSGLNTALGASSTALGTVDGSALVASQSDRISSSLDYMEMPYIGEGVASLGAKYGPGLNALSKTFGTVGVGVNAASAMVSANACINSGGK